MNSYIYPYFTLIIPTITYICIPTPHTHILIPTEPISPPSILHLPFFFFYHISLSKPTVSHPLNPMHGHPHFFHTLAHHTYFLHQFHPLQVANTIAMHTTPFLSSFSPFYAITHDPHFPCPCMPPILSNPLLISPTHLVHHCAHFIIHHLFRCTFHTHQYLSFISFKSTPLPNLPMFINSPPCSSFPPHILIAFMRRGP